MDPEITKFRLPEDFHLSSWIVLLLEPSPCAQVQRQETQSGFELRYLAPWHLILMHILKIVRYVTDCYNMFRHGKVAVLLVQGSRLRQRGGSAGYLGSAVSVRIQAICNC